MGKKVEITRVLKWTQTVSLEDYQDFETKKFMSDDEIRDFEVNQDMESVLESLSYRDNIDLVTQVVFKEG